MNSNNMLNVQTKKKERRIVILVGNTCFRICTRLDYHE